MTIKRKWLNPVGSFDNGSIQYGISYNKAGNVEDIVFTMSDCSRSISLNFYAYSKKDLEKAKKKSKLLLECVQEFDDMVQELGWEAGDGRYH